MISVGLTGDVGAGKSTLCAVWREMGATVVDCDTIARAMWFVPSVQKKAKKRWGEDFFDGEEKEIYRRIADKIFTDEKEYKFMQKLLYSAVTRELKKRMKATEKQNGWFVAEVPLLFEGGYEKMFDVTVYAAAPLKRRAERNEYRSLDRAELKRRQAKFFPRKERMAKADFVLHNRGTEEDWRARAEKMGKKFLAMGQ